MNLLRPAKREWGNFLILMPVINIVTLYIMYGETIWKRFDAFTSVFCINYLIGVFAFWMNVIVMHEIQASLPGLQQTVKRVVLTVLIHIVIAIAVFTLVFNVYDAIGLFGFKKDMQQLNLSVWVVVALVMLSDTLWESDFIHKKYKDSIIEQEAMRQLSVQQEFDTLKSQVNPHFLFNCFNTLSSLINEDRKQAEIFLNELSKVYRYLLHSNENGLSTLKDELCFINSYYQLLKTRHGSAIELQVKVDKKYSSYLLPSSSLQLLVENAVKHNIVSKNKQLVIEIFSTVDNQLVVHNNLQPKKNKMPSNKIGLANIRSKYELLNINGHEVLHDEYNFTVMLPLISSAQANLDLVFVQNKNSTYNFNKNLNHENTNC